MGALMGVLQAGRYDDGERITNKNWKDSISNKPERFTFSVCCSQCDSPLPFCLSDLSRKTGTRDALQCSKFGLTCVKTTNEFPDCEGRKGDQSEPEKQGAGFQRPGDTRNHTQIA